jgi:hypothetical protein
VAFTCLSVDDDPRKAKEAVKPIVAFIAGVSDTILERTLGFLIPEDLPHSFDDDTQIPTQALCQN